MQTIVLILMTLLVGFLCGSTSVGGVLLIPTLHACSGLNLRAVMGTVLFSFFFSALLGTWMHYKAGRIDWRLAAPLCLGCLVFGYPGALAKEYVSIPALSAILGLTIVLAGISSLKPPSGMSPGMDPGMKEEPPSSRARDVQLFCIGALVSFLSAMTGAGGPVLSVPIMLVLGYGPLRTIAIAQPLQVCITFSGSIGNMLVGAVDYPTAALLTVLMLLGVGVGVYSVRFFKPDSLKKAVSLLCVGTGLYMLYAAVL